MEEKLSYSVEARIMRHECREKSVAWHSTLAPLLGFLKIAGYGVAKQFILIAYLGANVVNTRRSPSPQWVPVLFCVF
jgi:hypothetical protein